MQCVKCSYISYKKVSKNPHFISIYFRDYEIHYSPSVQSIYQTMTEDQNAAFTFLEFILKQVQLKQNVTQTVDQMPISLVSFRSDIMAPLITLAP